MNGEFEADYVRDENPGRGPLGRCLVLELSDPTLDNHGMTELLAHARREFADQPQIVLDLLPELIDFLREHGALGGRRSGPEISKQVARFIRILKYIKKHANSTGVYAALHVWGDPLFDMINHNQPQGEFAASIGLHKAAVNNAVKDAQLYFELPPRLDQRPVAACETMRQTRIAHLERK